MAENVSRETGSPGSGLPVARRNRKAQGDCTETNLPCVPLASALTIRAGMLSEGRVRELLEPFEVELTSPQLDCLLTYLDLLLRWNQKINLTAIHTPEECVARHFGESLYLARCLELEGSLLDIGSGAGFPGLALKIAFPALAATLLEPVAKKRAFLKEVSRACQMESVEVRSERLGELVRQRPVPSFDAVTARAVGQLGRLIPEAVICLKVGGRLCLWLSHSQVAGLAGMRSMVEWQAPIPLPLARQREIWIGTRPGGPQHG
jgi:16S rRNA (guanine527-N7)-methyltransferase